MLAVQQTDAQPAAGHLRIRPNDARAVLGLMAAGAAALPVAPDVGIVCPLRRITGIPCPFCGMTTGTAALAELDIGASLAANPMALVLVVALVAAALPTLARQRSARLFRAVPRPGPPAIIAIAAALWIFQLARFDLL